MLSSAFLRFNLDILNLVAEHVMQLPLKSQYCMYYEVWYRSLLNSRKIKKEKISD
jgi:hypothetical protein